MSTHPEPPPGADLDALVKWASTKLTVSLAVSMYFQPPPSACVEGVLAIYKRYLELCEPRLTWFADETGKKYREASPEVLRIPFRRAQEALSNDRLYSWGTFAGKRHRHAAPYQFECLLDPDGRKDGSLNYLRAAFAVDMFRADVAAFMAVVKELGSLVPVFHGTGGFSFSESMQTGERQANEPYLIAAAMRFSGVDVKALSATSLCCDRAIRGVNWLTLVNASFVKRLGGEKALRGWFSEAIQLHSMPWGLMIQAGPEPGLGNVNEGETLPLYREVNRVLRPVRVPVHMNLGVDFDEALTRRWIGRFD